MTFKWEYLEASLYMSLSAILIYTHSCNFTRSSQYPSEASCSFCHYVPCEHHGAFCTREQERIWEVELVDYPKVSDLVKREKAMAPHSSTLAWKIPWTEEPGRLQSMGSLRVGHDWATSLSRFTFMHWRRKWQPTPVFLPGESQGRRGLVGCCLWGRTESDMTEVT